MKLPRMGMFFLASLLLRGQERVTPQPRVVGPGGPAKPPSDAVLLFNGKDMSGWRTLTGGPAKCTVAEGVMSCRTGAGDIISSQTFEDAQIHLEFAVPYMPARKDSCGAIAVCSCNRATRCRSLTPIRIPPMRMVRWGPCMAYQPLW